MLVVGMFALSHRRLTRLFSVLLRPRRFFKALWVWCVGRSPDQWQNDVNNPSWLKVRSSIVELAHG